MGCLCNFDFLLLKMRVFGKVAVLSDFDLLKQAGALGNGAREGERERGEQMREGTKQENKIKSDQAYTMRTHFFSRLRFQLAFFHSATACRCELLRSAPHSRRNTDRTLHPLGTG